MLCPLCSTPLTPRVRYYGAHNFLCCWQMPIIFYVSLWHSLSNASTGAALRFSSLAAVTAVQVSHKAVS